MSDVSVVSNIMDKYGVNQSSSASVNNDLDKDAFLNLLATQMKYQDPLEPTKNEEMLAQMAQFSALEQMQNLNTSSMMQQAYSLIGKTIIGIAHNDITGVSDYVSGVVESVSLKNGEAYLYVDGNDVALGKVEAVLNEASPSETAVSDTLAEINKTLVAINEKIDALAAQNTAAEEGAESETDSSESTGDTTQ